MPPKTHHSITCGCLISLCRSLGFSIWGQPRPAGVEHGHSEQGKAVLAPAPFPPIFPELTKGCPGPSSEHNAEPQPQNLCNAAALLIRAWVDQEVTQLGSLAVLSHVDQLCSTHWRVHRVFLPHKIFFFFFPLLGGSVNTE